MALHLHFAPSADLLLPRLFGELESAWSDPFSPPTLIVPSPAVGKWLKLRLTEKRGCVLGLETTTLERFLFAALRPDSSHRMLGLAELRQVVNALFAGTLLDEKPDLYGPVSEYIGDDPAKRVQLSSQIARLFEEYEFNRSSYWSTARGAWVTEGVDTSWNRGVPYFAAQGTVDGNERWQQDLYKRIFGADGLIPHDSSLVSLPRLHRLRRDRDLPDGRAWEPTTGTVLLFLVSKISHFHRNFLFEISEAPGNDLTVLLTNPCAEFWEDVDTRRRKTPRRKWAHDSSPSEKGVRKMGHDDYQKESLDYPADHHLLQLWGHTGKENISLWCQATEYNFEYVAPLEEKRESPEPTRLSLLQESLLRRDDRPVSADPGDESIRILSSPDRGREVETLRDSIMDLLQKGVIERPEDAAVYLPDPSRYLMHIERVFGGIDRSDPAYIPYAVVGTDAGQSLFAQGVRGFLALAEGGFSRAKVFELLRNPLIRSRLDLSSDHLAIWERWCGALGIFRGYNATHRLALNDAPASALDTHTFELGIARLLLGNLANKAVDLGFDLGIGAPGNGVAPFRDWDASDGRLLEKFCEVIERLRDAAVNLAEAARHPDPAVPVACIRDLVEEWFASSGAERSWNEYAEARCRREFLESLDTLELQATMGGRTAPFSFDEVKALILECLPAELPSSSKAWSGCLTFAPLRSSAILPHKAIFVLGLDAEAFPGTADRMPLNLLALKRIVGDPDPVRDNRFAFLELVHAARRRLVLSFWGENIQKDERLQPSSIVLELESFLAGFLGGSGNPPMRGGIPLVEREGSAVPWDPFSARLSALNEHTAELPRARFRFSRLNGPLRPTVTPAPRLTLGALRLFFRNPLEYHLRNGLALRDEEEDGTRMATAGPTETHPLAMSGLKRRIIADLLAAVFPRHARHGITKEELGRHARESVRRRYAVHVQEGGAPESPLSAMEEGELARWAEAMAFVIDGLRETFDDHAAVFDADFTLGRLTDKTILTLPLLDGRAFSVEGVHRMALLPRGSDREKPIAILAANAHEKVGDNHDLWLDAAVQWIFEHGSRPVMRVQLCMKKPKLLAPEACAVTANSLTQPEAAFAWLAAMAHDLFARSCDHLPVAVVKKVFQPHLLSDEAAFCEAVAEELCGDYSAYQSYLAAMAIAEPRAPASGIVEIYRRRLAPYVEGVFHV